MKKFQKRTVDHLLIDFYLRSAFKPNYGSLTIRNSGRVAIGKCTSMLLNGTSDISVDYVTENWYVNCCFTL